MSNSPLPSLERVNPDTAWTAWEPSAADPWNLKWAGHLYRRAAFGGTLVELSDAVKQGHAATIEKLFTGDPAVNAGWEKLLADLGEKSAQQNGAFQLRTWWVYAILYSPHPLQEKMTLFWHNHFATSIAKVQRPMLMFRQNDLLRRHALGKFGPFLQEISRDPAMLVWLDSNSNVKGKPNENYARELMELFSLGVGNYTEKDIREAARAFTGWTARRRSATRSTPAARRRRQDRPRRRPATGTATTSSASCWSSRRRRASWSASCTAILVSENAAPPDAPARAAGRSVPQERLRHRRAGAHHLCVRGTSTRLTPSASGSRARSNSLSGQCRALARDAGRVTCHD